MTWVLLAVAAWCAAEACQPGSAQVRAAWVVGAVAACVVYAYGLGGSIWLVPLAAVVGAGAGTAVVALTRTTPPRID